MKYLIIIAMLLFSTKSHAAILMVGDSVFAHRNHEIKRMSEQGLKAPISDYSQTGHWFWQVVEQYKKAKKQAGDIVIMDGGGNDIFGNSGECRNKFSEKCEERIDMIMDQFCELMELFEKDKIKEVHFLGPYRTTGWMGSGYNESINYGAFQMESYCSESWFPCFFIDPREKMVGGVFEWDGVHPNQNGTKILSDLIIQSFKNKE